MTATGKARAAKASRPVQWLGRAGLAGYGVVHLVVAWLALRTALGGSGEQADQQGAISAIAAQPFGTVLMWVFAVLLIAFGVWLVLAALVTGEKATKRLGFAARAVAGFALAGAAIGIALGGGGGSGDAKEQDFTAKLLSLPAGQVLVGAVGLGVLVGAAVLGYRGVARKFREDLVRVPRPVEVLGSAGYVAKGVAYGIIGVLLGVAAATADPHSAGGLDKALKTLAAQSFGAVLLVVVALGLAAFGCYCFADARYRRM